MTKRKLLDPSVQIAKGLGVRIICRECTPRMRARLMRIGPWEHPSCGDIECGCVCQDEARRS